MLKKHLMRLACILMLLFCFAYACRPTTEEAITPVVVIPNDPMPDTTEKIDILALGDSYTKGESVPSTLNFPNQLQSQLLAAGYKVSGLRIIAQTGWRTDQLKNAILNQNQDIKDSVFSIVTLCIGVNNQYQSGNPDTYRTEFEQLLQIALARAGGKRERVFVISIPDYAYTPFGQGNATISNEIDQYNTINQSITLQYGIAYVNITDISRGGLQIPGLVASDGLHPSSTQYTAWVNRLLPYVKTVLK
jgi:lysophospholipase L1-like esterase